MARFEGSRERRGRSDDRHRRRKDTNNFRGNTHNVEMTKVICSSCGDECEVPFKPTSDKPVYCDNCFSKKGKSKSSGKDFEIINEKLDKIMKALKID